MTNTTIDFGNLDYRPRLEKVLMFAIKKFADDFNNDDIVDDSRYYINSNCYFILTCDGEVEGFGEGKLQLIHDLDIRPSSFTSPQFVLITHFFRFEECEEDVLRHRMVRTVVLAVLTALSSVSEMSGSIRNVKVCFCREHLAPLGKDMCGGCERQSSLYDKEPCPICLEAQQVEAPWVEVPCCKKVFHQWCINRCEDSCPICRGKQHPYKLL